MKLTYDRDRNIAYLRLKPKGTEVESIRVSDELNVDLARMARSMALSCSMLTTNCASATMAGWWSSIPAARSAVLRSLD